MPQHKDIVSKDLLKGLVLDMAKYLFGQPLREAEILSEEHQRIETRHADLVVRATEPNGEQYLLHIEIQNNNDRHMPIRMMRYYADIAAAHPKDAIRQYLIYIGKEPLCMADGIQGKDFSYRYTIIDAHRLDCEHFLVQDKPNALIFAILCDFKGRDSAEVVQHILNRLQVLCGNDSDQYRRYLAMLDVLAANRDLQSVIKEAEPMLSIPIEKLATYELGMEKGLAQGMAQGVAQGVAQGREEGMDKGRKEGRKEGREEGQAMLVRQLLNRFDEQDVVEMTGLDPATVRRLGKDMWH